MVQNNCLGIQIWLCTQQRRIPGGLCVTWPQWDNLQVEASHQHFSVAFYVVFTGAVKCMSFNAFWVCKFFCRVFLTYQTSTYAMCLFDTCRLQEVIIASLIHALSSIHAVSCAHFVFKDQSHRSFSKHCHQIHALGLLVVNRHEIPSLGMFKKIQLTG